MITYYLLFNKKRTSLCDDRDYFSKIQEIFSQITIIVTSYTVVVTTVISFGVDDLNFSVVFLPLVRDYSTCDAT